jgi:hypothetical protein
MRRLFFVWVACSIISLGSFGVLLAEDLRLGLPLPYSMPLAFAATLAVAVVVQLLAAALGPQKARVALRPQRQSEPVVAAEPIAAEAPAAVVEPAPAPSVRRTPPRTQGVVLLDLSRVGARRHAA